MTPRTCSECPSPVGLWRRVTCSQACEDARNVRLTYARLRQMRGSDRRRCEFCGGPMRDPQRKRACSDGCRAALRVDLTAPALIGAPPTRRRGGPRRRAA